jgi:hypothetical protein
LLSYWFSWNPAVFQDSILRHREVGWAKDLSAPPCNSNKQIFYNFYNLTLLQSSVHLSIH